jgi:hypothetical protein
MNKTELLSRIHSERERLEAALACIDEARMSVSGLYGTWSIKDMLAHIGWWEQRATYIVGSVTQGHAPQGMVESENIDEVNAKVYQENHTRLLSAVRQFEREAYQNLLVLIESLSEADLFDPQHYAWTKGQPLANWVIWNTYEHYAEHLTGLQTWLAQEP